MNKKILFLVGLLYAGLAFAVNPNQVRKYYDAKRHSFMVAFEGKQMTIDEYDQWLWEYHQDIYEADKVLPTWMKQHHGEYPKTNSKNYEAFGFATRTIRWGDYTLTAWVIIDDYGKECSRWAFEGGSGWRCGPWVIYAEVNERGRAVVRYGWGGDSFGHEYGEVDKEGVLYKNATDLWDWDNLNNPYAR